MRARINKFLSPCVILAVCFITLIFRPIIASSEEIYRFEQMWPSLQQRWYFKTPGDIAVDPSGYVYVADSFNRRIQKFTSDLQFATKWGGESHRSLSIRVSLKPSKDDIDCHTL